MSPYPVHFTMAEMSLFYRRLELRHGVEPLKPQCQAKSEKSEVCGVDFGCWKEEKLGLEWGDESRVPVGFWLHLWGEVKEHQTFSSISSPEVTQEACPLASKGQYQDMSTRQVDLTHIRNGITRVTATIIASLSCG